MWNEGYYCGKCRDTGRADGSDCVCQLSAQESFDRFQAEQYKLSVVGSVIGWTHLSKDRLSEEILRAMIQGIFGYCKGHEIIYRRDCLASCPLADESCRRRSPSGSRREQR